MKKQEKEGEEEEKEKKRGEISKDMVQYAWMMMRLHAKGKE